jgi:hypothetical protein
MTWIKANVSVPIFLACFGAAIFALLEFFFKQFFGRPNMADVGLFIEDRRLAFLAAALWGATLMFFCGWYVNRKAGLGLSATINDVEAARRSQTKS